MGNIPWSRMVVVASFIRHDSEDGQIVQRHRWRWWRCRPCHGVQPAAPWHLSTLHTPPPAPKRLTTTTQKLGRYLPAYSPPSIASKTMPPPTSPSPPLSSTTSTASSIIVVPERRNALASRSVLIQPSLRRLQIDNRCISYLPSCHLMGYDEGVYQDRARRSVPTQSIRSHPLPHDHTFANNTTQGVVTQCQ